MLHHTYNPFHHPVHRDDQYYYVRHTLQVVSIDRGGHICSSYTITTGLLYWTPLSAATQLPSFHTDLVHFAAPSTTKGYGHRPTNTGPGKRGFGVLVKASRMEAEICWLAIFQQLLEQCLNTNVTPLFHGVLGLTANRKKFVSITVNY
ncbi:hypothetical protein BaRGS_00034362 [Batillaria attramentaria]|uniref:Uncharacterized protein n=1 Tax=Batillaria attramentaria TaxID=370345 RepID=A0ABD0JI60_9CAEN